MEALIMEDLPFASALLPALQKKFPDAGIRAGEKEGELAIIPCPNSGFGDIIVDDNEFELYVTVGDHTNGYFSNFEDGLSVDERMNAIIEDFIGWLEDVFADRMVVWSTKNRTSGGWSEVVSDKEPFIDEGVEAYTWSGPWGKPRGKGFLHWLQGAMADKKR